MCYKDYSARIRYSDEDEAFVGRVAGIRDIVGFHGESIDELRKAFHEAIDFYLEMSEQTGLPPQRPYSGQVMFRIPPELHARAATAAELAGKSLNQWATDVLDRATAIA